MSFAFQCRTCKNQINRLNAKNLFTDKDNVILKKLEAITGIWLTEDFIMPDNICSCCLSELDQATEFRNRCIKINNFWLRQNCDRKSRKKSLDEQIENQINNDPLSNERDLNIKWEPAEELSSDATESAFASNQSHLVSPHRIPMVATPLQEQSNLSYENTDSNCLTEADGASSDNHSRVAFHRQSRQYMYEQFGINCDDKSNDETVEEQLFDDYFNSKETVVDSEQSSPIVPATHSSTESQDSTRLHKRIKPARVEKLTKVKSMYSALTKQHSPGKRMRSLRDYFCDQCGRHFNDKANFNRHLQRHLGVKKFQCQECGHKDYSQHLINLHNRIQHQGEKPYACKYCGERYANSMARLRHQRNHIEYLETVAVEPAFTCKLCGKTFRKKSILDTHAVVHTGEQPFCCEICNVFFNRKSSLRTHYRSKFHLDNAILQLDQTAVNT